MTSKTYLLFFLFGLASIISFGQPPAGALAANPNIIYYAGGSCIFYDINNNQLLSVDAVEAGWSATPAKAAWVVVTPNNAGYFEFPNYSSNIPTCNNIQYLEPFWKSDTIYNELILLTGINSTAKLMFYPTKIISITNYDFSKTYIENTDYTISGKTVTQKSAQVSSTFIQKSGVKGNGQSNGLMNTVATSWVCVTYIANRNDWVGNSIFKNKSNLLPKSYAKLKNKLPIVIEAYGMSITAGLNVSGFAGDDKNFTPTKPYMHSYIDLLGVGLHNKFGGSVNIINGSCGGKNAAWINQYCTSMVVPNIPDLVILDMGMNDIWGTSNDSFRVRMQSCINKIKSSNPNTEFILIGNMLPDINSQGAPSNGENLMYGFLQQLKSLESNGIAVFDMTTMSDSIYKRKGAIHCTSNALHPNDYLARWYAQGLIQIFDDSIPNNVRHTYYVNNTGNNSDGLSKSTAWTSIDKINATNFNPGDSILFEGGLSFSGNIELDNLDGNDEKNPLVFSTYGIGNSKISTKVNNKCGFKATNSQGIHIINLIFQGPGNGTLKDIDGISFYTTNLTGYLSNILIKNVEVSAFGYCGIRFYSNWSAITKGGFSDVIIDSCIVHDCRENGIVTFGYDDQSSNFYQHKKFKISNTQVFNITGYSASSHKGSGIVLSQIDSSIIEKCVAYNNGTGNSACGGPGGIWVYSANHITIQNCESHHNSSGVASGCDGLGFDLDGGVTNSTLQYCYSHDNDGAGILLGNFAGARPWGNNTVRYNLSVNDARTNNSAVTLFTATNTAWNGLQFYNNTIYVTPSIKNKTPEFGAFQMTNFGLSMNGVECYNNIFQTIGGLPLITVPTVFTSQNPKFIGNLYFSSGQLFSITYGYKYGTLSDFRSAGIYCEKNGSINTGLDSNPQLINANRSPLTVFPLPIDSLNAFKIPANSLAKDAGLDLKTCFGIDPGVRDLWNNSLPRGFFFDIGAFEFPVQINGLSNSNSLNSKISIYPNPSNSDNIILDFGNKIEESVAVEMKNSAGQDIFRKEFSTFNYSNNKILIPVHGLPNGIYLIKVYNGIFIYYSKLVINR